VNYRGSPGYGSEFSLKGTRQVGRAIQDDIEDATQWAIRTGLAAPGQIAIVGGSYGGYSTLFALGRTPSLYRCGVSIAGVTDWLAIFRRIEGEGEYRFARQHWVKEIGDPETDEDVLREISPVNFAARITAPLLIIQGKEDRTVPARQAKDMIAALEKAGRRPESYFVPGEGHGFRTTKARNEVYSRVVKFLETNLGPGVPPAGN
jgi:dipeptidyl aminopeptidase/acylaminoacyl peptidase